ncbi:ubiquitin carboxyl-terminal hydrolase 8-like, partial [Asbolus verrucosus]
METHEKLHLANNLDALDLLAKRNCNLINIKKIKFQQLCNVLGKLYKKSQLNVLDQEKTYILLYRYINVYTQLLNSQIDRKFVEIRFNSEYEKVLVQYDETRRSLEQRYALKKKSIPAKPPIETENTVIEEKPQQVFYDEFITCQQLFSALEAKYNILLVDARPDYDFVKSRLDHKNCINVPDQCITSGLSAHILGKKLPETTQQVWNNRDTYDVIVLYDWSTSSDNFALTKLDKLRSALVDWDLNRNYSEKPVILNGGYLELLQTYPTLCINPHVYLYQKNNELDELLELDNIKYPTETDNTTHVMGPPDETPVNAIDAGDDQEPVSKESLIKENKEITISRQGVITQLLKEESDWKKINELCNQETNLVNLSTLKQKEGQIRGEISRLEQVLEELNVKKDDVKRRLEITCQYDSEDEVKSEELKEIIKIEEDDSEKLKILDVIAEERCRALKKARALKPKKDDNRGINNNNEHRETDRPVINRATKPAASRLHIPRVRVEPLGNV